MGDALAHELRDERLAPGQRGPGVVSDMGCIRYPIWRCGSSFARLPAMVRRFAAVMLVVLGLPCGDPGLVRGWPARTAPAPSQHRHRRRSCSWATRWPRARARSTATPTTGAAGAGPAATSTPTWPEPYPKCHHSPDAYGNRVAAAFGARFTQFACTGAQFDNGIATEEVYGGTTYRPPQFGDWAQQTGLNAEYDAAQPDLVLVTLGADDVHFVKIVTACVENTLEHRFLRFVGLECTRANHGAEVRDDFYANLAPLKEHYAHAGAVDRRRAPRLAVSPRRGSCSRRIPIRCPPTARSAPIRAGCARRSSATWRRWWRSSTARSAPRSRDSTTRTSPWPTPTARTRNGGAHHGWCSKDPWAYGLSVFHLFEPDTLHSQAPFHPSPRGQEAIAALVGRQSCSPVAGRRRRRRDDRWGAA